MKATFEITGGILRAGEKHLVYGDPFEFSCSIVCYDNETAFLKGAIGGLTKPMVREIADCLYHMGFTSAVWVRKKNGKQKFMKVDLMEVLK